MAREKTPKFLPENSCSNVGGICIDKNDCESEKISTAGSCPQQEDKGAVCCLGLSRSETSCSGLGGQCMKTCSDKLIITQALNCEGEEKCCSLV
ncbi:conserved hypothetical protein [Pediculus humanus corporis]|uniref:Uncharacterized protein n=1 Tax=Pediculus humanus subsp. corporis TaxID=121224 RepID=E0W0W7_PEDHC|nr:uncharacterized protein Phum_PHUM564690 [Pediculus humanus corporis]EEB19273.1 conserved hypothetical protein [Pediculus humanus corporis]